MAGLLAFHAYPLDLIPSAAIPVTRAGSALALLEPDNRIQTRDYGSDPSTFRPSAGGDILSWNFDHWEGRPPADAPGAWETFATNGILAVWCPDGNVRNATAFVYWPSVPNL